MGNAREHNVTGIPQNSLEHVQEITGITQN